MNVPILSVGIACIIAAIVGGGMKALGAEIPSIQSTRRQIILGAFGALLIFGSLNLDRSNQATKTVNSDAGDPATSAPTTSKTQLPKTDAPVVPAPKKSEETAKQGDAVDAGVIPPKPVAAPPATSSAEEKPRSNDAQKAEKLISKSPRTPLQQRDPVDPQTGEYPGSASDILTRECDAGALPKCVELGHRKASENPTKALAVSKKACDAGLYEACVLMGFIYEESHPPTLDYAKARFFYQYACDKGYLTGCVDLAALYKYGQHGVSRDYPKAAALLKRACDGNERQGCEDLGEFYEKGWGVSVDMSMARQLYQKACSAGLIYSCSAGSKIADK